ncbi:glycosyltransferase family 39 protein [Actinomycetes bacterium KLBMP 9759]
MPRRRFAARHLAVTALLGGTAALYLWDLSASGWANAFYAAAAQAGAQDWTAWFFGSSDAANAITVDKTPAALWVTGLSVRLFGLSSWSILVPQALMGVATVGLLYATARRTAGTAAGLLAGAALALTPVAVLMFRYNNPDALLTLLLVGAAYAVLRGVAAGRTGWLVLAATLIGFGFLTKMLQAFLVVPVFAAVWLLAAPTGLHRRVRDLVLACVALVVSSGWWVLAVELWPVVSRPYIGGSQTNSVLELVFGYNGFGRLTGDEVGSVGGGPGGGWGRTGLTRLFDGAMGGEIAWLLPAALVLLGVLVRLTRRSERTDPLRAATILWGGWLLCTGLVFSLMAGIFHGYYLVVLAPAIAALVGIGATVLWRARTALPARIALTATFALTVVWAFVLLNRTAQWNAWLGWAVLAAGAGSTLPLLGVHRAPRVVVAGIAAAVTATVLAGPAAYALDTAATPHRGAVPVAGPQTDSRRGGAVLIGPGGNQLGGPQIGTRGRPPGGTRGGPPIGGQVVLDGGGLLGSPTPSAEVTALLQQDADAYTWAAATVGSNNAAGYQLAAGVPVMAVGGFNGTDPAPTLEQFQQLVARGKVHWFVGGRGPGSTETGGSDASRRIADWVAATFPPTTIGTTVLYDLGGAP